MLLKNQAVKVSSNGGTKNISFGMLRHYYKMGEHKSEMFHNGRWTIIFWLDKGTKFVTASLGEGEHDFVTSEDTYYDSEIAIYDSITA
ncbi:hypothetical protein ACHHV8_11045 [Paenibacillus sp. TAB 01]|uniref:hypothetical protein n=1 Tax=Paenibacillus sp. TAB 01 TaxID=3368988 RepID=UPI0037523F2B